MQRCRPLLGTFVEITVTHADDDISNTAIDAAFDEILSIENLMNFYDERSELSQLNRRGHYHPMRVSAPLYEVLTFAKHLYEQTCGAFDVSVDGGHSDHIVLENGCVTFTSPMVIDLSGIAKGFAVDSAIEVLLRFPVSSALFNAGGDLRYFGDTAPLIWIRHPVEGNGLVPLPSFRHCALATSVPGGRHLDGRHRQPVTPAFGVSVAAHQCMIADALTKVVLTLGPEAMPVLKRFDAEVIMINMENDCEK